MAQEKTKAARVIYGGTFGKVGEVVELPEAQVKAGVASGDLDDTADAVAYARKEQAKLAKKADEALED